MRIYIAVFWLIGCSAAFAAGYDHFGLGVGARNRGDRDTAIKEFTAALGAGDLNAGLVPVTYVYRGSALAGNGRYADAVADATSALKLKPDDWDALALRGWSNMHLGNYAASITDYQTALAAKPRAEYLREEATAYWMAGDFVGAQPLLEKAITLEPDFSYGVLWLEVARTRAGNPDMAQMARDVEKIDHHQWPAPVFDLFLGKIAPEAVMTAALTPSEGRSVAGQQCEANFYIAEWWLAQHQPGKAWPLIAEAHAKCPEGYYEKRLADLELVHPH